MSKTRPVEIRLSGVAKLDRMELEADAAGAKVRFEDETLPDGQHGELATTAIITVSVLGLKLLAAWLMKDRDTTRIRRTVETVDRDGRKQVETIEIDLSSSKAPKADVLAALGEKFGVDPKLLSDA
jgi:hypothetical protein